MKIVILKLFSVCRKRLFGNCSYNNALKQILGLPFFFFLLIVTGAASGEPKSLKVGVYENSSKIFIDQNGKAAGFFAELLDEIAKTEQWTLNYIRCTWDQCLSMLEDGALDLVPDVVWSADRAQRFDFNQEVVFSAWTTVFVKIGSSIDDITGLRGKKIAVVRNSVQLKTFNDLAILYELDPLYIEVDHFSDVAELLQSGQADAGLLSYLNGTVLVQNFDIKPTKIKIHARKLHFAAEKGQNKSVLQKLDYHLGKMRSEPDSAYHHAAQKWLAPPKEKEPPVWIRHLVWILAGLLILVLLFTFILDQTVKNKTALLRKAYAKLTDTERKLSQSQAIANIGYWYLDLEKNELFWSDEIFKMFGLKPQQFTATYEAFLERVHPDDKARVNRAYTQSLLSGGAPYDIEHRVIRATDQQVRFVREMCEHTIGKDGKLTASIGVIQDITEKKAQEELQRNLLLQTISSLAKAIDKRDPYTSNHQTRVANLSVAIGRKLGLGNSDLEGLRLGALIHDIGKIHIPAEILNRFGQTRLDEFEIIKSHPQVGYDIIKDIDFIWPVKEMVLQHHEKLDGSGYPRGLKGQQIILEARILMVADIVEAITSHRPYRNALSIEEALEIIKEQKGSKLDPTVVDACIDLFTKEAYNWQPDQT